MQTRGRRRLLGGALVAVAVALAACPDTSTPPVPDEFAYVTVTDVLNVAGGTRVWIVELDLLNEDGNGSFFLRFQGPGGCVSETAVIFVPSGRDWVDDYAVNCFEQPDEVITFSLRETGFAVTDRDSIPPMAAE